MALRFTQDELEDRRHKVTAEMQSIGLDALLIFRQESMYYLTGYDTTGIPRSNASTWEPTASWSF